jgi:NitT/TauT family transport system ATP-binding protein
MTKTNPAAGSETGPVLQVRGVGHAYGDNQVLKGLDFQVERGELMCIVGPSGVGKTTLLECLTGLRRPSEGEVLFDGRTIDAPPRGLAIVFQDYSRSLMPWLSVLENVVLPLRSAGLDKAEREKIALEALTEVGLADAVGSYPWQLSGGMQQRVAIARALAYRPAAVIMDEPFASVDAQTRADLEDLLLRVRDHLGITILLVTHDIDEAVYLSDRVLALGGKPAGIRDLLTVDLPRQREQVATKALPRFAELRSQVHGLIRHV